MERLDALHCRLKTAPYIPVPGPPKVPVIDTQGNLINKKVKKPIERNVTKKNTRKEKKKDR